jgi:hypothetical protein
MRRLFASFAIVAASAFAAPHALATVVNDPVKPLWTGTPRAAEAGKLFEGTLELVAARDVSVANIAIEGTGWTIESFTAPAVLSLAPGRPARVSFAATPGQDAGPLMLVYEAGGRRWSKRIDLTAEGVRRATTAGVLASAGSKGHAAGQAFAPRPRTEAQRELRRLRRAPLSGARPPSTAPLQGEQAAARNITVTGRVVYLRGDGWKLGADNVRVEAFDEDEVWDGYLTGGYTDADGYFSLTFNWDPAWYEFDEQPDLLIYCETINPHVQVQTAGLIETNYSWETGTVDDYGGVLYDFGEITPPEEHDHPAFHIHSQVTRAWRWLNEHEGYNLATADVQWPETGSTSFYRSYWDELHIVTEDQWREVTVSHEYGHHWMNHYSAEGYDDPPYCNGFCDHDPGAWPIPDCGHCLWCRETETIAWGEGWPNWFADVLMRSLLTDYAVIPFKTSNFEARDTCSEDGTYHDPTRTEGFFTALLRDIDDAGSDDNDPANPWRDQLALGTDEIFTVADDDEPTTPNAFLDRMKARYPSIVEDLWETAKDLGYDRDATAPGAVTGLTSPSHVPSTPSTDATATFNWTRPTDDWSGVGGYSVSITAGTWALPNTTKDIENVTTYTSAILAPGTYYFNIRAVDRAERWSATYATFGPVVIRAPDPVNLAFRLPMGWDWFIMPRPTADATANNVQNPDSLKGNCSCTYWNAAAQNDGEQATGATGYTYLYVDDGYKGSASVASVPAGGTWNHLNRGPYNIRGGRHTFEVELDGRGDFAEGHETDNNWSEQWVWSPLVLTAGTAVTRNPPPDRTGGWDDMDPDDPQFYNCDGLRFTTSGWWNAVAVRGLDHRNDWDCRLHAASSGPANGFAANVGWSSRAAGCLDAVLVNKNRAGNGTWDAGVVDLNTSAVSAQYSAVHVVSQVQTFGTEQAIALAQDETIALREFNVTADNVGWVEIVVTTDTPGTPIRARWFDDVFSTGDLDDYSATMTTDEDGFARMDVNAAYSGYHCVVVFRDPRDGLGPANLTLRIGKTPPDLAPYAAPGWHASLTPRPTYDGMVGFVPLPDTLYGNMAATYLNVAVGNTSTAGATSVLDRIYLDGAYSWYITYASLPGGSVNLLNGTTAKTVRGGRHTLSMALDPLGTIHEQYEDNNTYGEQYVWSPLSLASGSPATRSAPPDPTGGFLDVDTGEPLFFNCDGLRTPVFAPVGDAGWWGAVAVLPGAASDVNVRLHEPKTGAKLGFESPFAGSYWGAGQSDYVLVDMRLTPQRVFDVGVIRWGTGAESYTAEAVTSTYRGASPSGEFGPFTLGANHILDLHEFFLRAGRWNFRVENTAGTVDWGVTLHPAGIAYQNKSAAVDSGAAWYAPAGADEQIAAAVPSDGYYCLAVWRARSGDLGASGSYRLHVGSTTVDVAGGVDPAHTALATVYPNPFAGATAIVFDLARGGELALEVFDVRGARVRTLARGAWPAGRHRLTWNGHDDADRAVPGGVYLVRLQADGVRPTRKVARIE